MVKIPTDTTVEQRATLFIFDTLEMFYKRLLTFGVETPKPILDKYHNPNPLTFFKVYSDVDIVLTHYMINEGLIAGVIKSKRPLLFKGSITPKGYDYLFLEDLLLKL
jgi:hypothetical protein